MEDNFLIARELQEALGSAGYRVSGPAASIAAALACIDRDRPDLAIVDVDLGGERSVRVAEGLCERKIPFVVVTGYAQDTLPASCRGAVYVAKPFLIEPLLALLQRMAAPIAA